MLEIRRSPDRTFVKGVQEIQRTERLIDDDGDNYDDDAFEDAVGDAVEVQHLSRRI
jgi:hypothetical protein